uniref:Uncharacterized protein n=1 Tax=Magallana gigas TaxID=29159 RepID=K1PS19_MAGGI
MFLGSASCSAAAAAVACKIKNSSKITLLKINPSQVKDGADPYSNIRDACARKVAKRSSYKCKEGQAPGGSTCLDLKILQYIYDLGTSTKYQVQVNAIAGACHSNGSKHYDGKAVDFQLFGSGTAKDAQEKAFRDKCTKHKGWSHGEYLSAKHDGSIPTNSLCPFHDGVGCFCQAVVEVLGGTLVSVNIHIMCKIAPANTD